MIMTRGLFIPVLYWGLRVRYMIFSTKNQKLGKGIVNAFYKDMWLAWNTFYNKDPVTDKEIQNKSLWNNERILIGKRVIHWKGW